MFKPYYRTTDFFLSCIEKIDAVQVLDSEMKLKKQSFRDLPKELLVKHTRLAIAMGEQSSGSQQETALSGYGRCETENYKRALRWIMEHDDRYITEHDVLYLHRVLTLGLVENLKNGRYRKIHNRDHTGKKTKGYKPPSTSAIPKLTRALVDWAERKEACHAIVLSAVFHLQLILIQPFAVANGRLGRAMGLWILFRKNYNAKHVLALEDYFAADKEKYFMKIQQVKQADDDFTEWIDYIAQGVLESMGLS
ncbi:Fic family protein [bacterium]|nr:Fic family protein [bacterium]